MAAAEKESLRAPRRTFGLHLLSRGSRRGSFIRRPSGEIVGEWFGRGWWPRKCRGRVERPGRVAAQRSGPAAGRAADRPLQPGVRPPSLTHISQVCCGGTIKNVVNAKLRPGLTQVLEESPTAAEEHGCQGNFQLINNTEAQVLLDHICAS